MTCCCGRYRGSGASRRSSASAAPSARSGSPSIRTGFWPSASPPGDANRQLRATKVDLAGGRGEIGGREQAIRTLAGKQSLPDLAATMIALPKGRKVRLDQLGKVSDGVAEPRAFATLDGRPIVAFAISRAKGAS